MSAPDPVRRFLGTGWRFPLRPDAAGGLAWSAGERSVEEAIWLILATAPGERPMLPRFGCGIHELVFETAAPAAFGAVAQAVRDALTRWEPRIDVEDVRVEPGAEAGVVDIRVDYRVRSTNAAGNMVYPFFIREGARV